MTRMYKLPVIFVFILLFTYGNNSKLNELLSSQSVPGHHSMQYLKYSFLPFNKDVRNVAMTNSVYIGQSIALSIGWSRTVITVENSFGQVIEQSIDYEFSLQSAIDLHSIGDFGVDIYKYKDKIVKEKVFMFCDPGPCYSHKVAVIRVNSKRYTIDIQPNIERIQELLAQYGSMSPEVQAVLNQIFNPELLANQLSLANTVISLVNLHLAIDNENVVVHNILPLKNYYEDLVKYVDANNDVHCFSKQGMHFKPTLCPADISSIPDIIFDGDTTIPVKYVDENGNVHCFDGTSIVCPEDAMLLPTVDIDDFYDNGVHYCGYTLGQQKRQTVCPSDFSNMIHGSSILPGGSHVYVPPTSILPSSGYPTSIPPSSVHPTDNTMLVKYTDDNGQVHCFQLSYEELRERTCPLDTSLIPEVNMVKYVDNNGVEYCGFNMNDIVTHFVCPSSLSTAPLSPIKIVQNAIAKYVDPSGKVHCYDHNEYEFSETVCPRDTSNLPIINPYKNFYKYVDANGRPHCFYKTDNVALLESINCPTDLSKVADLRLEDGHVIPIKSIGPDGRIHCFDKSAVGVIERACPADTSLLPEKNIIKFVDDNGVEHCYMKVGHIKKHIHCPRGQNNLLLSPISELSDITVMNVDEYGRVHCYKKTVMSFDETVCPKDISHLPAINPYKDHTIYADDYDNIGSLNANNKNTVKYTDANGKVHCFDISDEYLIEKKCPLNHFLLPEVDIVKYVDDHGSEYCRFDMNGVVTHFMCPKSLSMVPLSPIQKLHNVISQYTDPLGRVHCYDNSNYEFTETVCPQDMSNVPVFNPYKNFYKYVDGNGHIHCFYKSDSSALSEPINCPDDLSKVEELRLDDGHVIPIKHVGPDGIIHCFDMSAIGTTERSCPADTSLFPVKNIAKFVDEDGVEHCYLKVGHRNKHIHCPRGQNNLLLSSPDDLSDIVVKNIDAQGRVHCYKKTTMLNFNEIACPKDTSHLPTMNPYKDYVRYVDQNGNYCFKEHYNNLQAVRCPSDTSSIPISSLKTSNKIPVKYVDQNGRVHCFDMAYENIKEMKCPLDYSLLPEIDVAKYVDDHGVEYCKFSLKGIAAHYVCPKSLSTVPMSPLQGLQNVITKHIDSLGRVHCYDNNNYEFTEIACPKDLSNVAVFNPYKNFYKYVDANGIPHCFYKSGNNALLEPTTCPRDLSKVADLRLQDGHVIPIKHIGPDGRIHCFDLSAFGSTERPCPADTSLLPVKNIAKFVDDNGVEHCYLKLSYRNMPVHCPSGLNNLLLSSPDDLSDIVVKHIDANGKVHCYKKSVINFDEVVCPMDISHLPVMNPYKDYVKYVGDKGDYCFKEHLIDLQAVECPSDTSTIPTRSFNTNNKMPVKYVDPTGKIHCFDLSYEDINQIKCPLYHSLLPEVNIAKYLDDHNKEYCSFSLKDMVTHFACPNSLSMVPMSPKKNLQNALTKYIDPLGRVHCYDHNDVEFSETICPKDTSNLPVFNPYNHFYKYVDADGVTHCFHQSGKAALLEPAHCPNDLTKVADLSLEDGHMIPIKFVGPDGKIHCFDLSIAGVTEKRCPLDISLYPVKSMDKFVDDYGVEHCYLKLQIGKKHIHCPKDQNNLLMSSIDDLSDIVVKHTDDYGRVHCYKKMVDFDEIVCPKDTSLLPDVNPFKNHRIPSLPISGLVNNKLPTGGLPSYGLPGSGYLSSQIPSSGYPSSLRPSSGYPSSLRPSGGYPTSILPSGGYPTSHLPSSGYPTSLLPSSGHPTSILPSRGYPTSILPSTGYSTSHLPSSGYPTSIPPSSVHPTDNTMFVKYTDDHGQVHCFELSYEELRERTCPLDTSLIPEVNMVKYVDNNGVEYCGFNMNDIVTHFVCPSSLSTAPLSPIKIVQNAIAKYVDPSGKVHCYDHNEYKFSETVCPRDTSNLPIINPYKNFYKYVDANGRPHCFYKTDNVALLEPINCPTDLSKVADLRLEDGHVIPIKSVGPDGRIHCFDKSAVGVIERACPADTSLLPEKNIIKFVDDNGVEHCYMKVGHIKKHIHCPRGQNNLLLSPISELSDIIVMNVDEYGRVHCYKKTVMSFDETVCPKDISHLPAINPYKDHTIYADDYDNIGSLNANNKNTVKYTDANGNVHCFDISDEYLTEKKCPLNHFLLPEVDIVKYVDDHGSEYCRFDMNGIVTHFMCPKSLSMVPLSPIQKLHNVITQYTDPLGRVHCYDNSNYEFTETVCPQDMSNVPVFNPYKNFYKYVDGNGNIHCFYKSDSSSLLEPINCPDDLSKVEELRLDDGHVIPIKHVGPDGIIHCFDMSAIGTTERHCPADTSLFPEKNIVKFVDEDGVEHCYLKVGHINKHIHCPRGQNNLLLSSPDDLSDIVVKNIDAQGRVHCYKKTTMLNFNEIVCPKDTSHLPTMNPYKDYVRYVDQNGNYCFKEHYNNLQAVRCPSDTSSIPISSLKTSNKIPVKYVDQNGRVHCFDMAYENIKEMKCPLDYSLLPEIDVAKYVDDQGVEYCKFSLKGIAAHYVCPKSLSAVPMSPLPGLQNVITKHIDSLGRVHCYDNNNYQFTEIACPKDLSNVAVFNPYKNFYKYVDANGIPHCFYKSGNSALLEPTTCPRDLSKVEDLRLQDGHVIPIKHIGPDGRIHCFDLSAFGSTERPCPADTSLFPVKNIAKFVDDNGVEHCYLKLSYRNMPVHCPSGLNNLLLSSPDDLSDIVVKHIDANGKVHCYKKSVINFDEVVCPMDISHLPVMNPYKDYVKYVGDKGDYCFKEHLIDLQTVECPSDTSTIPTRSFNTNNKMPVKYVDPTGKIHCFDLGYEDIKQIKCPLYHSLLPEVNIAKYLDDHNREYCSFSLKDMVTHFACPNSLSMVPMSPKKNLQNVLTKYIDPLGRVHCYDHNDVEFSETVCPKDTSNLPVFNPYNHFYKYVDADGVTHCFHQSGKAALLEPAHCPDDLSKVADLSLEDGHMIPIKFVGPDGKIHCFDLSIAGVTEKRCPLDTSLYPVKSMDKFVDDYGVEHCYLKLQIGKKHIHCPKDQNNLLMSSIDDLSDIVVKHTDDYGRVHCYKKMVDFDEIVCPKDTSLLPDVNPFKNHRIPSLPISGLVNNKLPTGGLPSYGLPGSGYPSSQIPSSGYPSSLRPSSGYPSSLRPSGGYPTSILPSGGYPTSHLPSSGYPSSHLPSSGYPTSLRPSTGYPSSLRPSTRLPNISALKDLNGNLFCYDTSGPTIVNVICPADVSNLPPLQLNGGKNILSAADTENGLQCYKVFENYMEITNCPRDVSKLPHVLPLNAYNGQILDDAMLGKLHSKPEPGSLSDILYGLNKGSNLSPNGSGEVNLTYDELSKIIKLMCKKH